jgi:ParB family chromosome partitioning protein
MEKKALGRGLEALLPSGAPKPLGGREVQELPVEQILPNPFQPRQQFPESELAQLAESVKQNGLLQPVLVRQKGDGRFELIVGERRLRAAKMAGLSTIPALVRNSSDEQTMELALVENLQRKDLNPMEAARAYHRLTAEFGFTQDTIARRVGKDRSSIANIARLLNLSREIQDLVESGALTTGHAKVILGVDRVEKQLRLARQIVERQLSVRQAEKLAAGGLLTRKPKKIPRDTSFSDLEQRLQKRLGTRVSLHKSGKGGRLVIHYDRPSDLDRLLELLLG